MVFCNKINKEDKIVNKYRHNPYFNRWFSAIQKPKDKKLTVSGHNPYFNRWFSAKKKTNH